MCSLAVCTFYIPNVRRLITRDGPPASSSAELNDRTLHTLARAAFGIARPCLSSAVRSSSTVTATATATTVHSIHY